jgi:hypothetical protein
MVRAASGALHTLEPVTLPVHSPILRDIHDSRSLFT